MDLPTPAQVNAAARHVASFAGGAIVMFGLSSKISPDTLTSIINATGALVNDLVLLVGLVSPIVAGYFASHSASPVAQAAAVAATGAQVITTPAIARAVPSSNVMSSNEVKVVAK